MSSNMIEFPARPTQPTTTRVTRAQREWLRRVLNIEVPRQPTARPARRRNDRTTLKQAA